MSEVLLAVDGDAAQTADTEQLARYLRVPLLTAAPDARFVLHRSTKRIALLDNHQPKMQAITADFESGKATHRRQYGGGKGQDFAKALGLRKFPDATIIDATAGLGGDAFVMATLGCQVTMLERNPVVQILLDDALRRADQSTDSEVQEIAQRMRLVQMSALEYLETLRPEDYPQLIYLDPMFPERGKSAMVKKEMRVFQELVGDDDDSAELLPVARRRAMERIIVKRPVRAPLLADSEPDFQISGKTVRYDVYLGCRHSAD